MHPSDEELAEHFATHCMKAEETWDPRTYMRHSLLPLTEAFCTMVSRKGHKAGITYEMCRELRHSLTTLLW